MEQEPLEIKDMDEAVEWIKHQIILPEDDYDEDDELEDRILEIEKKQKQHFIRGNFRGT